jgi:hypothetical protein
VGYYFFLYTNKSSSRKKCRVQSRQIHVPQAFHGKPLWSFRVILGHTGSFQVNPNPRWKAIIQLLRQFKPCFNKYIPLPGHLIIEAIAVNIYVKIIIRSIPAAVQATGL